MNVSQEVTRSLGQRVRNLATVRGYEEHPLKKEVPKCQTFFISRRRSSPERKGDQDVKNKDKNHSGKLFSG